MLQLTSGLPFWQWPSPSTSSFTVVNPAPVTGVCGGAAPAASADASASPPPTAATAATVANARRNGLLALHASCSSLHPSNRGAFCRRGGKYHQNFLEPSRKSSEE